jgi:enoyl-CoA hydratase/carnithine racemase
MTVTERPVLVEHRGPVAIITLNRPQSLNAWTDGMEQQYFDALTASAREASVRAIVVTGAGRAFCAGVDMDDLDHHATEGRVDSTDVRPKTFPLTVGKPVIAAVNGACAGMGLVQALMCDLRFAAEGAKLTSSFSKIGLIAEHGASWLLAKHVGIGHALDILLSSRIIFPAEALRMGLVNRVCRPESVVDDAASYAEQLAGTVSPRAMSVIKAQIYEHYNLALENALKKSNDLMRQTLDEYDFREGVSAFVEGRPPEFPGLSLRDWSAGNMER